jgi:hypothetical protein
MKTNINKSLYKMPLKEAVQCSTALTATAVRFWLSGRGLFQAVLV